MSKVQVSLYARNLPNVAGLFKGTSDPYAIVKKLTQGGSPVEIGRTEVVKNTLSPTWTKRFIVDYELGHTTFFVLCCL